MRRWFLAGVGIVALSSTLVVAQDAPTSLLPPGFDDPAPTPSPTRTAAPTPRPTATRAPGAPAPTPTATGGTPVVQPIPGGSGTTPTAPPARDVSSSPSIDTENLPSLRELEAMSVDELDELLGLKPKFDIPPAARRGLSQVGILAEGEGGLPTGSLANQPGQIVAAALAGIRRPMVSRWGHIMLRRALASRLTAPADMDPVRFAALRAQVLNTLGEHGAARALVQDVDTADWDDALTSSALDAYVGTADLVGTCPAVRLQGNAREDAQWKMLQSICRAFAGEGARATANLNRDLRGGIAPRIDILLAQRFAGAAGRGRRAVNIEWDEVEELTPWRFALANALGEEVPTELRENADSYYLRVAAKSPALPLAQRLPGVRHAAQEGILSSAAMVDFYSQIYASGGVDEDAEGTARQLRSAYIATDPVQRLAAIRDIWGSGSDIAHDRQILTAYAAARIPANGQFEDDAALLIASMLTAGLDRDALRWGEVVSSGSAAWAMLALAAPTRGGPVSSGQVDSFIDQYEDAAPRRAAFLVAGLAGLDRLERDTAQDFADRLEFPLTRNSKWSRLIDRAATVDNRALVAFLAGVGMQGDSWDEMTPRHLYHIVSALNRVGMNAEARMIAAEAVARG